MTLPSQHGRIASRRSYMYQRRRSRRGRLLLVGIIIVAICIAGWYFLYFLPGQDDEAGDLNPQDRNLVAAENGSTPSIQSPRPIEHPVRTSSSQAQSNEAVDQPQVRLEPVIPSETTTSTDPGVRQSPQVGEHTSVSEPREPIDPQQRDRAVELMNSGMEYLNVNKPVEGRQYLTFALDTGALGSGDERIVREQLTALNAQMIFSPEVISGDPYAQQYTIASGDVLSQIPRKQGLSVDWRFLQSINNITDPRRIRAGQRIKLITGPFHAVVHKRDFRMDIYLGEISDWIYVCSFPVGLGEYNSTPTGMFQVRLHSKLINPQWVNPRTGKRYESDDPDNPIGERWIGLQGVSEAVRDLSGYGLHGTIEPESIGKESSLGCIRLRADDVELVYQMLVEERSTVEIRAD